jgi:hypothetical protein
MLAVIVTVSIDMWLISRGDYEQGLADINCKEGGTSKKSETKIRRYRERQIPSNSVERE